MQSQIANLSRPRPMALQAYRTYFNGKGPRDRIIFGKAQGLLHDHEDLAALQPPSDVDILSRLVRDNWPQAVSTLTLVSSCVFQSHHPVHQSRLTTRRNHTPLSREENTTSSWTDQYCRRCNSHHRRSRRVIQVENKAGLGASRSDSSVHSSIRGQCRTSHECEKSRDFCSDGGVCGCTGCFCFGGFGWEREE